MTSQVPRNVNDPVAARVTLFTVMQKKLKILLHFLFHSLKKLDYTEWSFKVL